MGFDNIQQRAAQPELNRELAHPTVFDKMIADYFLQKRGQYVATNELIDQLNAHFDSKGYEEGHKYKTNDPHQVDQNGFPFAGKSNMYQKYLQQQVGKEEIPRIKSQDYTEMMELDITVS